MGRSRCIVMAVLLAVALRAADAGAAGWYERMTSRPAPSWAVLIDPLGTVAGLYSGVIQVKPQVQFAFWRHFAVEAAPMFLYAYAKRGKVQTEVIGGGGLFGLRLVWNRLSGPYLSTRFGPLSLRSKDVKRLIMLLEVELGWSWAPRTRGLIMNGGMGYQGYYPLDRESRLYYVAAHSFMINYSIGYAW
jgi:hypothetical protein